MKLSIIIPIYNAQKYIGKLIRLLMRQIDENSEIILIDDGSTDHSYQIVSQLISTANSIRLIRQENGGASSARNTGLNYAQGEYVAFIDSDDIVTEDYIPKLLKLIEYKFDLYQFEWMLILRDDKYVAESAGLPYGQCDINTYSACLALQKINPPWNKLYRREIISKNNIKFDVNMIVGEDLAFALNFLMHTKSIYISDYKIYKYYDNPNGLCGKVNPQYFYDNTTIYNLLINFSKALNDEKNLWDKINLSTLRSAFRTIGLCKKKGYHNNEITLAFVESGLENIVSSMPANSFQDKIRKYLIKYKEYNIILILIELRQYVKKLRSHRLEIDIN